MNAQEANKRSTKTQRKYSQIIESELDIVLKKLFESIKEESDKGFKSLFLENQVVTAALGPESKNNTSSRVFIRMVGERIEKALKEFGYDVYYTDRRANHELISHNYAIHWNTV